MMSEGRRVVVALALLALAGIALLVASVAGWSPAAMSRVVLGCVAAVVAVVRGDARGAVGGAAVLAVGEFASFADVDPTMLASVLQ